VTKKIIFIDQPRFLGDIIFIMAIAQKYTEDGNLVEFPIDDQYLNSAAIYKNFPSVNLIPLSKYRDYEKYHKSKVFEDDTRRYLLLSDSGFSKPANQHMRYKYESIQMPMSFWRSIKITRDYDSENKLIAILGIKSGEKFNLINTNYSNRIVLNMKPLINNGYRNIHMSKIDGFNIFDWMGVIERAESIHTVHTSLQYILDVMPSITDQLNIYLRSGIYEPHSYYDYIFEKKYIYHGRWLNMVFESICLIRALKKHIKKFFNLYKSKVTKHENRILQE
jgi:hypothetical protein